MTHIFIHNSFDAEDVVLTRAVIQAIRVTFSDVAITLECSESYRYLWQDLDLPILVYQGSRYTGFKSTENCIKDQIFVNMWFGVFDDILALYGITYENNIHTFNRQIYQRNLHHKYLLPNLLYTPMISFFEQSKKEAVVHKNSILIENSKNSSNENYFLDAHLKEIASDFPQLNFYCSAKPSYTAPNIFDCSSLNLIQLSRVGDQCIGLVTKGNAVNAVTQTEINRYKPRCIVGWDLPIQVWGNFENPTIYAKNYDEVKIFLQAILQEYDISDVELDWQNIVTSNLPEILFVSHKQERCGVYQYGVNIIEALKRSTKYSFIYAECSSAEELTNTVNNVLPAMIIYNHHGLTLPWLQKELISKFKVPQIAIIHEISQQLADLATNVFCDYYIAPDPTLLINNPIIFKTGRLIPPYTNTYDLPEIPTIGSFGFGLQGKGFEQLVSTVQQEFDRAIVKIHIPVSDFADPAGNQAYATAKRCQELIVKPGIKLIASHEFLSKSQLLDFLAQNTINAFFYDKYDGRGISSTIDYALAVQRPIAITKSNMFRHIFSTIPSICIEDSSLTQIINNGITPLLEFYKEWQESSFISSYEQILNSVLAQPEHDGSSQAQEPKLVDRNLLTTTSVVESKVRGLHLSQNHKNLVLFQTAIGNYYLPTDVSTDIIVNEMKAGRVFEPEIVEVAKQYIIKGSTVLDVGANFGQMTLLFSELVGEQGRVFSFEADDFTSSVLEKNIAVNNRRNITCICKAMYDKDGDLMFYPVPDFERFGSYGSYGLNPKARDGRKVETMTIDSLNIQSPISFMKVDVQGSDLFVLRGAVETIKRHQMPIIFEFEEQFQNEFGTSLEDHFKFIDFISYKVEKIVNGINYLIVPQKSKYWNIGIPNVTSFNRILDNAARSQYQPVVDQLFQLVPDMMSRKILEANVQQAFVVDTFQKFASQFTSPKTLCVGSFEDTAAAGLKRLNYQMEEIDPEINYDLNTYLHLPSTIKGSYDMIFSTSVLEHVQDDELFMTQIAELLAPGGTAILTCDYNDQYKPGDLVPIQDFRFYTQKDLLDRILPLLKNCSLVDVPKWDCPNPDFMYAGCRYTFATFVFQKNKV